MGLRQVDRIDEDVQYLERRVLLLENLMGKLIKTHRFKLPGDADGWNYDWNNESTTSDLINIYKYKVNGQKQTKTVTLDAIERIM